MANWNYDEKEYSEKSFALIPVGNCRVRIADVVEKKFKSGNEGYEMTLDVSGQEGKLWFYLVLIPDNPKQTNQNIGTFFDCFDIKEKNLGTGKQWIGKCGAACVKHEAYNEEMSAKIKYLISRSRQTDLAPWVEPGRLASVAAASPNMPEPQIDTYVPQPSDIDLPLPF